MSMLLNPHVFALGGGAPLGVVGTGTYLNQGNGFATVNHTLPSYSAGDLVLVQWNYPTAGGGAGIATPSGWTALEASGFGGATDKYGLLARIMNGSEGSTLTLTQTGSAGAGNRFLCQSISISGVKSAGTYYEGLFRYQQKQLTSAAKGLSLQAHGGNRIALHFYFAGYAAASAINPAVDAFTDAWSEYDSSGSAGGIACSYKAIGAAELTDVEQRTGNNQRWAVISLVILGNGETAGILLPRRRWTVHGLYPFSTSTTAPMSAAELEFRLSAAGADTTTTGQAIASSEFSGAWVKGQAFNNNASDAWGSSASAYDAHWIGQDYGAGNEKALAEILYTARNDGSDFGQSPRDGLVIGSPDGVKLEGRAFFENLSWTLGSSNTITVPT